MFDKIKRLSSRFKYIIKSVQVGSLAVAFLIVEEKISTLYIHLKTYSWEMPWFILISKFFHLIGLNWSRHN